MTEQELQEQLTASLDAALSGLREDAFLAPRIIRQGKGEKTKMKKRMTGGLALAIVLTLLLATTALAISGWDALKGYFEDVRRMDQSGELARWSDEDKLKLLSAMARAGLIDSEDESLKAAMNEALPLRERAQAAEKLITARYGAEYFDSHTIEQIEFPEEQRSEDERQEYADWNAQENQKALLQTALPITQTRTWRDTMDMLTEIGEFPAAMLRQVRVESVYDEAELRWRVVARINREEYLLAQRGSERDSVFDTAGWPEGDDLCFEFYLDAYGNYLGVKDMSDPQARATLTLEEARPIAEKALRVRKHIDDQTLKALRVEANYGESSVFDREQGRFRADCHFIWRDVEGDARYTASVDAQTGEVFSTIDWSEDERMREQERVWLTELRAQLDEAGVSSDLYNAAGQYFWAWTLEERAAWSAAARPIVDGYLQAHSEFSQYLADKKAGLYSAHHWDNLINLTRRVYGVPDESAISRDAAFDIARRHALALGARQSDLDENRGHLVFYDVTNLERPVWRVSIQMIFSDGDLAHRNSDTDPWGYIVDIDARSGELMGCIVRDVNTEFAEVI